MTTKRRVRKPNSIELEYCGGKMIIHMDLKMSNAWLGFIPCDLKALKRLHKWLGKAIAYLEQEKK